MVYQVVSFLIIVVLVEMNLISDQVINFEVCICIEFFFYVDFIFLNKFYFFCLGMLVLVDIYICWEEGVVSFLIQVVIICELEDDDVNLNNNDNKDLLEVVFVIVEDSVKMV